MADRFCGNCGSKLSDEDRFCRNCGRPVDETAHVPTPEADVPTPPPRLRAPRPAIRFLSRLSTTRLVDHPARSVPGRSCTRVA
jgi:predicted amidophosphoribosyltransferase